AFFGHITQTGRLISLFDIENREAVFPSVHRSYKFCLLTLGQAERAEFVCFATQVSQLADARRRFTLTPEEFRLINPNTLTCPVFRSERDAELTKKLYRAAPVLIAEDQREGNPWGISFMAMLHMSADSHLFQDSPGDGLLPLYEAKMIHQFDHRWATYLPSSYEGSEGEGSRDVSATEKKDPHYTVTPRYWVSQAEVEERLIKRGRNGNVLFKWDRQWLMGWRNICRATDERSFISSVIPRNGVGHSMPILFTDFNPKLVTAFLANMAALVFDYLVRQKLGGTNMTYGYFKQLPTLPPTHYTSIDLNFIVPRVLELTYTAHDLKPWAQDLGFDGPPFAFNPDRRAQLRAELDAYYARLYQLTRDELRYILDPADVMGEDYPSETFRVLKNKEMKTLGEYRTQGLVLAAWDQLETGALH
ncbi:MAG: SAM-dependent DNA methyltransferase, partial [Methylococcaceae bacterium]